MKTKLRLAIIGAGALTEGVYLPVLKNNSSFDVTSIVDINRVQATKMGAHYQIPQVLDHIEQIDPLHTDAALIVLPNFLHASASIALLKKGIHVLVEKPMANTSVACMQMNELANASGLCLAVGLVRRFYPTTIFLREVVQKKLFGDLISFDFEEGYVFDWKLQSDYLLSKEKAGGGVLMDTGIHMLDQLIYCIGMPQSLAYYDDNKGGVEADCKLIVTMDHGVKGTLSFSRIRPLRNSMIFQFEQARIEVGLNPNADMSIRLHNGMALQAPVQMMDGAVFKIKDAFHAQLTDFAEAIINKRPSRVSGEDGLLSIQLVEQCFISRKSIQELQSAF